MTASACCLIKSFPCILREKNHILAVLFLWRYEPVRRTGKSDDWVTIFCSHNKVHCSEIPIVLSNLLYRYFFHWIMAHFIFVISQNAKWGHAGFYIDCHRMTALLTCAWLITKRTVLRPPIKNQNMRTGKYSFTKKHCILALETASPGNRHCANCIGTVLYATIRGCSQ